MLDPWTRKRIVADLKLGLSYNCIIEKYQVKRTQVSHVVRYDKLGRKRVSDQDLQKIAELAKKNTRTIDISEELNLSVYQVVYSLRKLGLNRGKGKPCQVKQKKS